MPVARSAPPPLTRSGEAWRIALAALLGLPVWWAELMGSLPGVVVPAVDLVLGVLAITALHWRRRWPARVALLTTLISAVSALGSVASLIAFVSLSTTRRWRAILPVGAVAVGVTYVYEGLRPATPEEALPWWGLLLISVLITTIAMVAGLYIGARRELRRVRQETAEREESARVEQVRQSERARIAREMHDVLAHRISLVSLHAGAMTYRTDLSADELRGTARVVEDNARQALVDLRDVLGLLRDSSATGAGRTTPPQPTLADLPDLVREAEDAGTPLDLRRSLPDLAAVPDTVGRTAYRVLQEALTNARKHAPGAPVVLQVTGATGERLEVDVRNPLLPATVGAGSRVAGPGTAPVPGAGMGLVGLAERVSLAGGTLLHGTTPEHEYRVTVSLPWPA